METEPADRTASSHPQKRCMILSWFKLLESVGARRWKYILLGVVLTSFPSLLFASTSFQSQRLNSSVLSFLGASRSAVGSFVRGESLGPPSLSIPRRGLIPQEIDYEDVALIEKRSRRPDGDAENAGSLVGLVKESEDHTLLRKVSTGDDDYESVALTGGRITETEWEVQDRLRRQNREKDEQNTRAHVGKRNKSRNEVADPRSDHGGVGKLLDRLKNSVENEEDGRFNKTISEQEGVLETVARVRRHSFDGEGEEERTDEEKEVLGQIDADILGVRSREEISDDEEARHSKEPSETDVTWLDRIMGQSDQTYKPGPPHSLFRESRKSEGGYHSSVPQKKNSTREKTLDDNVGYHQVEDVPRLIDREDNEYVISYPGKNRMMLQEDLTLISDIVMVIVGAALGGTICGLLGQPVILGYLTAGMVVGPGGLHLVHELVQVETLAQFGVVFLLFVLGVEFNPSKMQGIHNVTLGGGCLQIGMTMLLGGLLGSSIPQGVFIGAFLSMSSTAVVVKCLMDSKMSGTEHGQIMLGTLILQDCVLGLLLAVMPALAAKGSDAGTFALAISRAALLLLVFCGSAWALAKLFIPRFLRALVQLTKFNSELFLLGAIGVCLSLALISQSLGLSLEVGAFIGGLVLSGGTHTEKTLHQVEPIRNVFAALFLASIGMVMHPIFLWEHKDILMTSLGVVFIGKTCLFAAVVRTFGYSSKTSVSVGIALAQIGEFAFILLSRAQGLGLVSKKLYLLLMGTSALSLVLTPFAFKIVIRLNPPGRLVFRKATSKPASIYTTHTRLDINQGFQDGSRSQEDPRPLYWSLASLNPLIGSTMETESVHTMVSSILKSQEELVESIQVEDGRCERPSSPARAILRRPYHQVISGKWKEWRKELEFAEVSDHRR